MTCKCCGDFYIGKTENDVKTRIWKHVQDVGKFWKKRKDFNSAFKYNNFDNRQQTNVEIDTESNGGCIMESKPSLAVSFTTYFISFLSYFFFILTFPITYWIFVKKLGEFDRLVVYRLGRMTGVKGPGRVLVFPWMDRTKRYGYLFHCRKQ